jgi:hypothetical protein
MEVIEGLLAGQRHRLILPIFHPSDEDLSLGVVAQFERNNPSGAKARDQFALFAARVNSCPFKTTSN